MKKEGKMIEGRIGKRMDKRKDAKLMDGLIDKKEWVDRWMDVRNTLKNIMGA